MWRKLCRLIEDEKSLPSHSATGTPATEPKGRCVTSFAHLVLGESSRGVLDLQPAVWMNSIPPIADKDLIGSRACHRGALFTQPSLPLLDHYGMFPKYGTVSVVALDAHPTSSDVPMHLLRESDNAQRIQQACSYIQ